VRLVLITAAGVGSSTVIGALIGFYFKKIPRKYNDAILGFAAGIMLSAALFGLIVPSLEEGSPKYGIFVTVLGIFCGALFLNFADKFTPHLHSLTGIDREKHKNSEHLNRIMLFVLAIAIHNLPEGIAAGVGFGTEDIGNAISVAVGISLQNIPEGMVIISPLLNAGVSRKRVLLIAFITGLIEVIGTFIGYFSVTISHVILPFALAFAGGTMIYVISDEMIPETHSHGYERMATYSILAGFVVMMLLDHFVS
jgi:ZIP family zinc transporter